MTRFHRAILVLPIFLALAARQVTKGPDGMYHMVAGTSSASGIGFNYGGVSAARMRTPYPIIKGLNFTPDMDSRTVAVQLVNASTAAKG